jgi:hypothetical protein
MHSVRNDAFVMPQRFRRGALYVGLAMLAAAMLLQLRPWRWPWTTAAGYVVHPAFTAAVLAAGSLVVLVRTRQSGHADKQKPQDTLRWSLPLSNPGILIIASTVVAIGVVAFVVMLLIASKTGANDRASLQIEAIKYGLGFFAAGGAAAALLLGVRRQQSVSRFPWKLRWRSPT